MKKKIFTLLIILFSPTMIIAQMDKITGDSNLDLQNLLNHVKVTVDIIDKVKYDPRYIELTEKIKISIQKNHDWFVEYSKTIEKGKPIKYHPNLGITKKEYDEFLNSSKEVELLSSGQETLKIIKKDSLIKFQSNNRLEAFNSVVIDLKNNQVLYKKYTLTFQNNIDVKDAENGLKSK